MKTSIVVVAVAAAFAGSVAAQETADCRIAVGWWTILAPSGATGATKATMDNSGAFGLKTGTKYVTCTVPTKAKNISTTFKDISQDECSVYNGLASSDSKLAVGKLPDAKSQLGLLYTKINTLAGDGKLSPTGAANISAAVSTAYNCVDTLINQ